MKPVLKWTLLSGATICVGGLILSIMSSYLGWYGYEKWMYRVGSDSIEEAKQRGVFVKELNFQVEGYSGELHGFTPFIEKGYRYGYHISEETVPLTNSNYPYQLSFQYKRNKGFGVLVIKDDLNKFDSSGAVWGYLKEPNLTDTITLEIGGEGISRGARIKVW